jgi:outer membrane protein assembly factor BamB
VGAVAVVAAGVGAWGLRAGWFDEGSVTGGTEGFVTSEAPRPVPAAGSWPEFGFDPERTRANTALRSLVPPFSRRWRLDAGSLVEFPPVVGDGRVVLGTNAGLGIAADLDTGRVLWRRRLGGVVASSPALTGLPPGAEGPARPPALALFTTMRGDLVALDAATGGPRWRLALRSPIESSPLVVGDGVYLGTKDGRVVRVSLRTRRVVWTARAAGEVKGTLARAGDAVVVGDYAGTVAAYAMRDGAVRWRTTSPGPRFRGAGRFYAGPAVAYGRVYVGNVNARMLALSAATGEVAWVRVAGGYLYSSAAVADRVVYVGSYDRRLYALDAVTGAVRWRFDARERISGSPSVVGGLVWVATIARRPADGRLYAVDAGTGRRVLTIPEGRYAAAVGVRGTLVVTGVRTVSALEPR